MAFAAVTALGVDESYMVAAARVPAWGYFDHPPLAWWLVTAATHLAHSEATLVVRAPFILLFAGSTWLMARFTHDLAIGPEETRRWAGVKAAAWLNLAPLFGVATGSWVLPDGPMVFCLLAAGVLLLRALDTGRLAAWIGAGALLGLAGDAKYSAVLPAVGVVLYLATFPRGRALLRRPHPWLAAAMALLMFAPVILWNAQHHWVSFGFQGGRADGHDLNPLGPILLLAGGAAILLPWTFWWFAGRLPAAWRNPRARLCVALAAPAVALFVLVAVDSHGVLVHWPEPGYLFLFPLLGLIPPRHEKRWLAGSAVFVVALATIWLAVCQFGLIPSARTRLTVGNWNGLQSELASRGLLNRPNTIVGATNWIATGKAARALGPETRTLCFNLDCREFSFWPDAMKPGTHNNFGHDVLLIAPGMGIGSVISTYGDLFRHFTILAPVTVDAAGRKTVVPLYIGHDLRKWP